MRILAYSTLKRFCHKYPDAKIPLDCWFQEFKNNEWENPHQIKMKYPSASIIGNHRIVFNIKGNHYRLIAAFRFETKTVFIKFVGTHAQYDKVDALTVDLF